MKALTKKRLEEVRVISLNEAEYWYREAKKAEQVGNKYRIEECYTKCAIELGQAGVEYTGKGKNIKWNGMEKALAKSWKHILD